MTTNSAAGRPKKAEQTLSQQLVLTTALRFIKSNGAEAMTFRVLADLLDVTPMAVKYHTGSKRDLLIALVEQAYKGTLEVSQAATPKERIRCVLTEYCSRTLTYPSLLRAVLEDISLVKGELVRITDELRLNTQRLDNGDEGDALLHVLIDYTHGFALSASAGKENPLRIEDYQKGLDWILSRLDEG